MTERKTTLNFEEASQIYYINKEIKRIQLDLAELEQARTFYKPIKMDGMPRGSSTETAEDRYLEEKELLEDELNYALRRLQYERRKIERFINSIKDAEMRLIVRLRCINNMNWKDIGREIGRERTTVSKKFYRFFEDQEKISHNSRRIRDIV